uniref:G-protein coupled receptors family 1 profile domain-containing protein n=1 Tax=Panagrolaimus davidi TaxID=227884 RepID=A0A914Q442_9BILA
MAITFEQYIIAISTTLVCTFGLAFNGIALFLLLRLSDLRNAFGYMCTSHIIANFGVIFCFLFWGVPMTLTQSELSAGNIGKAVAGISILFWEVSIYSHVFVALNRFVAINMPLKYMSVFGKRTAFTFIAASWILAIAHVLPFFVDGCGIHYTIDSYLWLYDNSPCSQWIAKWMDFYLSWFWMVFIGFFDIINVIKIVSIWRGLSTVTVTGQRKRRETIFFAQAFSQNILFAVGNYCFHSAIFWVSDTIAIYMLTTFFWGAIHGLDGLILILFNVGMHRRKIVANLNTLFKNNNVQHPWESIPPPQSPQTLGTTIDSANVMTFNISSNSLN